jgi:molybdate transport system substrate-binding protein
VSGARPFLALVAALTLVVGPAAGAAEGEVPAVAYAAASLTDVLPRIDSDARFQFAGSNQLAIQIRQGAPADVFASASPVYTQALYREGLVERPRVFATNTLVLAVPRSNPARLRTIADLARRPGLRLVDAGPKVPVGLYTRQVLKRLGLLAVLRRTVSQESDVKGIVGKLALGEADAGFVYATDVRAASGRLASIAIPKRAQPSVRYEVAVVTRTKHLGAAWSLVADLLGAGGRRELARAGFGLPQP